MVRKVFKAKTYLAAAGITQDEPIHMTTYSIKAVYQRLQGNFLKVSWRKIICNNQGAQKWIFILWLAIQGRLTTKDRIGSWGIDIDPICPLCGLADETIQHFVFECNVTGAIWRCLLRWQGIPRANLSWTEVVKWAERYCKGRSLGASIHKITLAATVYHVWLERNGRVFKQKQRSREAIVRLIIQEVYYRASLFPK
ncbi:uncharacterized protein LOC132061571 [Lycium ferocissimum]|uniref:uncharacterized protein LOC132061571 n=1 Tax=Lycium ferocissimum TaxID=112874 RepID=UPI002815B552|nr:uncharacterized protein LOC132061571 [Lycium ferocissimum]